MNDQDKTSRVPLGKALQDARLRASLTIEEIAEKLNLAVSTVRDIEDELDNVMENKKYPRVYLRGYLVNYAKLVAFGELKQFPEYQQLSDSQIYQRNLRPSANISPVKKRGKSLLLLSVLIAVVCLVFFIAQQIFFSESKPVISDMQERQQENTATEVVSGQVKKQASNADVVSAARDVAVEQKVNLPATKQPSQTAIVKTSESAPQSE
jgi:cytoskeleton protein RodZ